MKFVFLLLLATPLCTAAIAGETSSTADVHHEHHAPHGGTLVEIGEEFAHIELVEDDATGKLTAYALDGEAENAVRLKQKSIVLEILPAADQTSVTAELLAVANPLTGETEGDTSEYASSDAKLKSLKQFSGTIRELEIRGGKFKNVPFSFPSAQK